jgi:hypothetical protein
VEIVPDERNFASRHFVNCYFSGAFSLRFRVNGVISRELRGLGVFVGQHL